MQIDLAAIGEIIKDKVGRKQVIALGTIAALAWLVKNVPEVDLRKLCLVAGVGVAGIIAQSLLDWKYPRNETPPTP